MADRLKPFLRAGERVIYRTPRPWPPRYRRGHGLMFLVLGLWLFSVNERTDWSAVEATVLGIAGIIILIVIIVLKMVAEVVHRQRIEVAVTDQRVLRVDTTEEVLQFRAVELAEIGDIEAIHPAVRVKKTNGDIVEFEHLDYAWDIALAAQRAAGLPQPPAPGPMDKIADIVTACSGLAGYVAAAWLQIHALSASGLISFSFPLCLLLIIPLYVAQVGWLAMEPMGLIALRPFYRADEARAWIRFYASDLGNQADPKKRPRLSRWRLRYFSLIADLLYGRPPKPADDGAERGL